MKKKLVNCQDEDDTPELCVKVPSGDGGTYELEMINQEAYKAAMDRLVCPDWFDHPAYMGRNGRMQPINTVLSVEVLLVSKIAHNGLVGVMASLKNNTSSFWPEVTTHLAMAWMRIASLEQTAGVIKKVQLERRSRKE